MEINLEGQRRFPLDTANHLRGRLRRLHFSVYKKGSKGVSLVCAVKRKFRSADDNFAEPVLELIEFIEKRPGLHVSRLAEEFLEHNSPLFNGLIHIHRITLPPMSEETREEQKEARKWVEARMKAFALRSDFRNPSCCRSHCKLLTPFIAS